MPAIREVFCESNRKILDEDLHGLLRSAEDTGPGPQDNEIFDDLGENFDGGAARSIGAKEGATSHEGVAGYYLDLVGPGKTCKGENRQGKSQRGGAEAAVIARRCYRGPTQPREQKVSSHVRRMFLQ